MKSVFFPLLSFLGSALAAGRTSPPSGALVVGNGGYSTIQAAVNALKSTTSTQSIFINPGTYSEQVTIKSLSGPLIIYGYTTDTSSYGNNQVTIKAGHSQADKPSNDETATLRVETSKFKLYNVNVVNTYGKGSQALAVSANNGDQGYYGCSFKGYQDTLLAEKGRQLYSRCYIEGLTDFIFGQTATAWFEQCTLGVVSGSISYITASGRDSNNDSYYVFNKATVAAAPGQSPGDGIAYLGRPWRPYARVTFQNSSLSKVINSAGWTTWNGGTDTGNVAFGEYSNSGAGASGTRVSFAKKLGSAVSISSILGSSYKSDFYVDTAYL